MCFHCFIFLTIYSNSHQLFVFPMTLIYSNIRNKSIPLKLLRAFCASVFHTDSHKMSKLHRVNLSNRIWKVSFYFRYRLSVVMNDLYSFHENLVCHFRAISRRELKSPLCCCHKILREMFHPTLFAFKEEGLHNIFQDSRKPLHEIEWGHPLKAVFQLAPNNLERFFTTGI